MDDATEQMLTRIDGRIETLIEVMSEFADVLARVSTMSAATLEALKAPPKTDFAELIRTMIVKLDALPSEVVKAIRKAMEEPRH
jgi:hypothetical protein